LVRADDLNKIEKVEFDKFRMTYSAMPKLPDLIKPSLSYRNQQLHQKGLVVLLFLLRLK